MTQPAPRLTEVLHLRASPDQLRRWRRAARADGRGLSNWVRWVLDQGAETELPAREAESDSREGFDSEDERV